MELKKVLERFVEGIAALDVSDSRHELYMPGVASMTERNVEAAVDHWWGDKYPCDFVTPEEHQVNVPYVSISRSTKCDFVFTTE